MKNTAIAFVGDVHGEVSALHRVLHEFGGLRHLVFLGDYVNRGPSSRDVIQTLLEARGLWGDRVTFLRGNHDQAVLDFLKGGAVGHFAQMGGISTIASYAPDARTDLRASLSAAMPAEHVAFLRGLLDYFETDDVFASHCGPDPNRPLSRERSTVALGSHPSLFDNGSRSAFGKAIVCGHYIQRHGRAHTDKEFFAIDTGHGSIGSAPLSVLLWPERQVQTFEGV